MPIRTEDSLIALDGHCTIEEAEALFEILRGIEEPVFDLAATNTLHTAIVQLIMASSGVVRNIPDDPVLAACFHNRRAA
ncbi:hypothetical protein [Lichenifustis flavocetrariae]|uniref:Uncharacterized protein n=1 Tax=Lichenifustis flavocetrariae TaxID=2949735 RepID=A0AA41Z229_9HYPH|nr:hypothetical protein [Lichenifustis flavocetrariae]MCW6511557.1 hypothetical protein [Lichenifustis flavocetrariae]